MVSSVCKSADAPSAGGGTLPMIIGFFISRNPIQLTANIKVKTLIQTKYNIQNTVYSPSRWIFRLTGQNCHSGVFFHTLRLKYAPPSSIGMRALLTGASARILS